MKKNKTKKNRTNCLHCKSTNITKSGFHNGNRRYKCKDCGKYCHENQTRVNKKRSQVKIISKIKSEGKNKSLPKFIISEEEREIRKKAVYEHKEKMEAGFKENSKIPAPYHKECKKWNDKEKQKSSFWENLFMIIRGK